MKMERYNEIRTLLYSRRLALNESIDIIWECLSELTPKLEHTPTSDQLVSGVIARLKRNAETFEGFIPAIKWHREQTGSGLLESKTFVENIIAQLKKGKPHPIILNNSKVTSHTSVSLKNLSAKKKKAKTRLRNRKAPKSKKKVKK